MARAKPITKGARVGNDPRISMQLDLFDLLDVYRNRTQWWALLAILTLQLEHAWAVECQDFWHISVYKNAIEGIVS